MRVRFRIMNGQAYALSAKGEEIMEVRFVSGGSEAGNLA